MAQKKAQGWTDKRKSKQSQDHRDHTNSLRSMDKFNGVVDSKGRLQFANEAPFKALGYTEDEILRRPFWEAEWFGPSPESQRTIKDGIIGALEGDIIECRVQTFTKDGTPLPVTFTVTPLKGTDGDIVGIVAQTEPLEEARAAQAGAEESKSVQDKLLSLAELAKEAYFETDASDRLTLASTKAATLLGYNSASQIVGRKASEFWANPEERDRFLVELSRKSKATDYHASFLRADRSEFSASLEAQLLLDADGEMIGSQIVLRDISAKSQLGEQPIRALAQTEDIRDTTGQAVEELTEQARQVITLTEQRVDQHTATRNYFHSLIENLPDNFIILDGNRVISYENSYSELWSEYQTEEVIGVDCFRFLHPDDLPKATEVWRDLTHHPSSVASLEVRYKAKDDSWRYAEATSRNLLDDPWIGGVLVVFRDITGRKETEKALQEAEIRYSAIFNNPLQMVLVHDEEGHLIDANEATLKKLEYLHDGVTMLSLQDIVHPEDLSKLMQAQRELAGKGYLDQRAQIRLVSKSMKTIWAETYSFPMRRDAGQYHILQIARDITETVKAEKAVRQREQEYSSLVELSPEGIILLKGKDVIFTNRTAQAMFNFDPAMVFSKDGKVENVSELLAGKLAEILSEASEEEKSMIMESLARAAAGDVGHTMYTIPLKNSAGEKIWVEVNGNPIEYRGENVRLAFLRDTTQRKKAEIELKESERRLQEALRKLRASYEELSTPVVQLWENIIAVPLIGVIDTSRAKKVMDVLLNKIMETRAQVVILDITGVLSVDTQVANHLIQAAESAGLLGAECIITGINPDVAHTMVTLGVDMTKFNTKRDLYEGLSYGLSIISHSVADEDSVANQQRQAPTQSFT